MNWLDILTFVAAPVASFSFFAGLLFGQRLGRRQGEIDALNNEIMRRGRAALTSQEPRNG